MKTSRSRTLLSLKARLRGFVSFEFGHSQYELSLLFKNKLLDLYMILITGYSLVVPALLNYS